MNAIVIGCGSMVRVMLSDMEGSLVTVAARVTVLPMGTYAGAV